MPPTAVMNETPPPQADARAGKYLTFQLANEEFGIRVLKVREIMGLQEITAVPQTPGYVKGVINLRGKVIPVIDLRLKFGLPDAGIHPAHLHHRDAGAGRGRCDPDGRRRGRRLRSAEPDRHGDRGHARFRRGYRRPVPPRAWPRSKAK